MTSVRTVYRIPNLESRSGIERDIGKRVKLIALANQLIWSKVNPNSSETGGAVVSFVGYGSSRVGLSTHDRWRWGQTMA